MKLKIAKSGTEIVNALRSKVVLGNGMMKIGESHPQYFEDLKPVAY